MFDISRTKNARKEDFRMAWRTYKKKGITEMRPYEPGEVLRRVSISDVDELNGSPKEGDMIARNPDNKDDRWLIAKEYYEKNYEEVVIHQYFDEEE